MSFVQFNLLPDVKLEFDRAQRLKRMVYTISFLAVGAVIALFILSFLTVNVLQKKLLSDANTNINKYSQQLKNIPNLAGILTIQNQLKALPSLHQSAPDTSLLLNKFLPAIVPSNVNIGKLDLDTTADTIEISGTSNSVENINKFVDTLKFTNFTVNGNTDQQAAFSDVVLSKVDRNDQLATYTIDLSYSASLFDPSQNAQPVVPNETTTRSVINTPSISGLSAPLFNGETDKTLNQQNNQNGGNQ